MSDYQKDLEEAPPLITMVSIPYEPDVYLHISSLTRWRDVDEVLERDYDGELEWKEMGEYANKTYEEVFREVYNYSLEFENKND